MDEFDLIKRYFAPLAGSGADGLNDDVACLNNPSNQPVIVTTDAIVEGVHFLASDPLDTVARKLLRVNVSDILAKGATPFGASLVLVWPENRDVREFGEFASGLKEDLEHWGVALLGGDTTSTRGPLMLAMTLHGACLGEGPVRRSGAKVSDHVFITGTIGRSWLGLKVALGDITVPDKDVLLQSYRVPEPPDLKFADIVAKASSSIDVSDGLIADAGHLSQQSGVQIHLNIEDVPFAPEVERWLEKQSDRNAAILSLLTGGDDYQTLFTIAPEQMERLKDVTDLSTTSIKRIGSVVEGKGVRLIDKEGAVNLPSQKGWMHF